MQTQYIRKEVKAKRSHTVALVGAMVAVVKDDKLQFGYSLLNPVDAEETKKKNSEARKVIAEMKRAARKGKASIPGTPEILPVFNKKEAIALAQGKVTGKVNLDAIANDKVRRQYHRFIKNAVATHHLKSYLA